MKILLLATLFSMSVIGCASKVDLFSAEDYGVSAIKEAINICKNCKDIDSCQYFTECKSHTTELMARLARYVAHKDEAKEIIKVLIEDGGLPVNYQGDSLLFSAVYRRTRLDLVKYLVESGANVNAKERDNGGTILFFALWKQNNEIAKYLLAHGANVDKIRDIPTYSACDYSVDKENFDILPYIKNCCEKLNRNHFLYVDTNKQKFVEGICSKGTITIQMENSGK